MPFHMVGSHRRIRLEDLLVYKQNMEKDREEALTELTRISQELRLITDKCLRHIKAILDANVLYPFLLRDLLLSLAQQYLYIPKWSDDIENCGSRYFCHRPD